MKHSLKSIIKDSGITKRALAKKMNITEQSLINKLNGRTKFSITEAFKLSEIFQIDIKDIFFEENNTD